MSLFAGKEPGDRPKRNKRKDTMKGGIPQEELGKGWGEEGGCGVGNPGLGKRSPPLPASTEGIKRGRNSLLNFLSQHKSSVCTF
jgi:hypothetical protein